MPNSPNLVKGAAREAVPTLRCHTPGSGPGTTQDRPPLEGKAPLTRGGSVRHGARLDADRCGLLGQGLPRRPGDQCLPVGLQRPHRRRSARGSPPVRRRRPRHQPRRRGRGAPGAAVPDLGAPPPVRALLAPPVGAPLPAGAGLSTSSTASSPGSTRLGWPSPTGPGTTGRSSSSTSWFPWALRPRNPRRRRPGHPPGWPRPQAAASPASARSWTSFCSNSAYRSTRFLAVATGLCGELPRRSGRRAGSLSP